MAVIREKGKLASKDTIKLCFELIVSRALNNLMDHRLFESQVDLYRYLIGNPDRLYRNLRYSPIVAVSFDVETMNLLSGRGKIFLFLPRSY